MAEIGDRVTIASRKDFDVSYFCGSGPGGQARNKVASGVQIIHRESGAIGRASDSRSQHENRTNAFLRLTATAQFKFWVAQKKYEIREYETIEQSVSRDLKAENLKIEIKNRDGQWMGVPESYFNTKESDSQGDN